MNVNERRFNLILADFLPIAAIATTPGAAKVLLPVCLSIGADLWVSESLGEIKGSQVYSGSLREHIAHIWSQYHGFIFGLATGAVVRLIAPLLKDKSVDPAVIVIDENGKFVISLCGGHQGGADRLARAIALSLNATPILTGAANGLGLPAVDLLGVPFGWNKGAGDWTKVAATIAKNEPVQVIQEVGSTLWQNHLPKGHPFYFEDPENQLPSTNYQLPKARIWISFTQRRFSPDSDLPKVQWHPRVLWLGIGCERGSSKKLIESAIQQVCQKYHLAESAIAGIATIDIKADEVGLIEVCQEKNWPLKTFSAEILGKINVPNPSTIVAAEVGTPSVAEAAAICAGLEMTGKMLVLQDWTNLLVKKQIFRLEGERGAVTIAVGLSEKEYSDRTGKILLIGTGPGQLEQMTIAAQMAISQADAVVGYSLYIDLISPLLKPGQIVESLPITQEVERAKKAIELADKGLTVAVISSGDSGIYGMAGLVLEELQAHGWDGQVPGVQVFPGITALQAAASLVGAPLMHDFCAVSLSDLLTPWSVIEKRLIAAAEADFVTALYNPKSQTRTEQIAFAQQIFLKYRNPTTPVAIVRSAYRETQEITITTLEKLLESSIDMLTIVLIGNSNTLVHGDWMITPRGYKVGVIEYSDF
ncbi:precorrin-3B C(17)-methyltransferase [Phormidium sp. LEGE 05292]|uniref:precorrin-3B C(17)-methyltransferase n=1 Tax=[Phormidium] sp. LEGE 05292 TaxID=767427 RepID=UPI00187F1517|nr:precorrin-3B C(17)-methyltransferase [Phormidium sp. LEGE 05292]MBE9226900.1 precorrin-3B C(17)-methyltransferase [Phormidium sp. LEGE 05292]